MDEGYRATQFIQNVCGPYGVAITEKEQICVTENSDHRVSIFDNVGNKIRSFGSRGVGENQFNFPRGIAVSLDRHLLITDSHRIKKVSTVGLHVKHLGGTEPGNKPTEFNCPSGLAVDQTTGEIFVADTENDRVQVFTGDLQYSRSIGGFSSCGKVLSCPVAIALDGGGHMYVAEWGSVIKKMTLDGECLLTIGKPGIEKGHLSHPTGIAVTNKNLLYVTERGNHRVSVFNEEGFFLKTFGQMGKENEDFNGPYGIALAKTGTKIYCTDYYNDRVVVYNH